MPIDAEIYYHVYGGSEEGQKPPLVLLHGAGGNYLFWPSQVRRLPGARVYSLDLPGHGKSGGRGQQSIPTYASSLVDWLEKTHIYRAIFVGHSMGSAIALTLALDYPEHVAGLVLMGAGARLKVAPELLENAANPITYHQVIDIVLSNSFSPRTPTSLVELAGRRMAETRSRVLYADFLACNAFDEIGRIQQIRKPTLIICGSEDRMTPPRYSQFLADKIPGARLEILSNAGHMVMIEQPDVVAAVLVDFVSSL